MPVETVDPAWELWKNGGTPQAGKLAEEIPKSDPANSRARHLRVLALYVCGEYQSVVAEKKSRPQ